MTDEIPLSEQLSNLETRMGNLERRMDAITKQGELLRVDLDRHFDRMAEQLDAIARILEERLTSIDTTLEERLPAKESEEQRPD